MSSGCVACGGWGCPDCGHEARSPSQRGDLDFGGAFRTAHRERRLDARVTRVWSIFGFGLGLLLLLVAARVWRARSHGGVAVAFAALGASLAVHSASRFIWPARRVRLPSPWPLPLPRQAARDPLPPEVFGAPVPRMFTEPARSVIATSPPPEAPVTPVRALMVGDKTRIGAQACPCGQAEVVHYEIFDPDRFQDFKYDLWLEGEPCTCRADFEIGSWAAGTMVFNRRKRSATQPNKYQYFGSRKPVCSDPP